MTLPKGYGQKASPAGKSHRNPVLRILCIQALIFGGGFAYFSLAYFSHNTLRFVLPSWQIMLVSLLVMFVMYTIHFRKRYLPLTESSIYQRHLSYTLGLKILYIAVPFLILFIILSYTNVNLLNGYSKLLSSKLVFAVQITLTFIITYEFGLCVAPLLPVKDFTFYYAKAFVTNSLAEEKDEVKRIKFLFVGLNSFAKYLRSHMNFDIDSAKVYPKIMVLVSKERKELIDSLYKAFSEDIDKLKPISCLAASLKVPVEQILIKESIGEKIKQLSGLLIPIITVGVSVIQLLLKPGK